MALDCSLHGWCERGRIADSLNQLLVLLHRQADELRLLDRAVGRLLRGNDDEVADRAPLDFGGAFDDD
jgi:hypothetical protein